jgi:hypothetical protein
MVRIEIKGANLGLPIEITDPRIEEFTPWAGPGAERPRFAVFSPNGERVATLAQSGNGHCASGWWGGGSSMP